MLLGKEPSKFEVYNDIEGELVNFFRIVKNRPAELLLELDLLPLNSREEFVSWLHFHDGGNEPNIHLADQLEIIDRTTPTSLTEEAEKLKTSLRKRSDYRDVRQAAAYLMRVRNSYSSSGRSFACQPFNVRTLFTQIWEMSRRLENVIIEQQSFEVLIPHYDREDSFFYGDPPYYDSEYVYDAEFGWDHHVLLRDTLAKCKGKWLVSQVDCQEIRYLFRDYQILDFKRIHPMVQKYAPGKQFPSLEAIKPVGRKTSGIKGVCRANPATPDLRRPATPVGVSKCVTVSDFCYEVYTGERKGLSVSRLFCVTKGVKGKMSPKQENTAVRTGISISRELLNRTDEAMKKTGARSRSDFIAEALDFYMAWLHSKETSKVLTPALESVISGRIGDTENRIARVLFKQSVELAMLMHVVAATHAVRPEDLDNLRKMCVGEVSKINGKISFEDAVKLQKK